MTTKVSRFGFAIAEAKEQDHYFLLKDGETETLEGCYGVSLEL